jgi:hypothetical protein
MALDLNKPTVSDNYSTGYTQSIIDNFRALSKFCDGETVTNPVTGSKRYNATNDLFEEYSGSWVEMPLAYLKLGGGTVTGSTNFTNGLNVNGNAVWHAGNFSTASFATISGCTFTGAVSGTTFTGSGRLFGNGATGNNGLGKITVSTSAPSGGAQGDIWFQY